MKFLSEWDAEKKVYFGFISIIRISLIVAIAIAIINFRWLVLAVSTVTLILTFLPKIFEKRFEIDLPLEFEVGAILFIYATLFLGEVHGYYTRYWWWDLVLHSGSALGIGMIGFIILFIMDKSGKIKARPITIAIFTFCFALAIGALWEIFEFAMDQLFGLNMQKSGLLDTMSDLIVDAIGAFVAATFGFLYLKKVKIRFITRGIEDFVKDNPSLFKKAGQ